MLRIFEYANLDAVEDEGLLELELPYDLRKKSRVRTQTVCGREAGLFLERGNVLKAGDLLKAESGELLRIVAAEEEVSTITSENSLLLLKAAYHLGNRHVPLQICRNDQQNWLRYQRDYVLDDMVSKLGLVVKHEMASFHPESGAYHQGGHDKHHHDDEHSGHTHHHG